MKKDVGLGEFLLEEENRGVSQEAWKQPIEKSFIFHVHI